MKISDIKYYFSKAREISKLSDFRRSKHGSVIVHNKNIISMAHNRGKVFVEFTKRFQSEQSLHSELAAILKVKNKKVLKDSSLFVYRELKNGTPSISRPCDTCMRIIKSFGITHVYYSYENPEGFKEEWL
jgi:deoxycytidylate deaminase